MADTLNWSWAGLLALGAFHGVNPGMGWLFATSLGLQERRRSAVYVAMLPLAFGHGLAIAVAVAVALISGAVVPENALRWCVAMALLALGIARLGRHGHPRWVGMRVGLKDLTVWSFLMASAHGAGLMVVPLVVEAAAGPHAHAAGAGAVPALVAAAIHTAGYLVMSAAVALLVFEKFGVAVLRKAWFNLDLVWAIALVVTGVMTIVTQ